MKVFAALTKLLSIAFKKDSQDITVRPNQATTYSAARDIQLPAGDTDHVLVSAAGSVTLTNKTIDGDDNTLQDIGIASLKTVLADADEAIVRNASGEVVSAKIVDANVDATAAIAYSKLSIADGDLSIAKTNGLQTALDGKLADSGDTITGDLVFANQKGAKFSETTGNGSSYVYVKAPASLSANLDLVLPSSAGSSGYVLSTDGSGNLSWVNNAAIESYKTDWITSDGASLTITHSLNSLDVIVQIFDKTDGASIEVTSTERTDADTVTVTASEAPGAGSWRVLILKV